MLKFTVLNNNVCVDPNIILIKEFDAIVQYGIKKKDPNLSNRLLLYIFYCCDLTSDNPVKDVDFRLKESQAMAIAFRGEKKSFTKEEEKLVNAGIDAYNFYNETSAERAIYAIDKKIDEARTSLEAMELEVVRNTDPNNGKVTFTSNEGIMGNLADQIGKMMTLKLTVANAATKLENTGRVRGGKGSSIAERSSTLIRRSED